MKFLCYLILVGLSVCSCRKAVSNDQERLKDSTEIFNLLLKTYNYSLENVSSDNSPTLKKLDSILSEMDRKGYRYPLMVGYVAYSAHGDTKTTYSHLAKADRIANSTKDSTIHAINYHLKAKYYHINNDRQKAFKYALLANDYSRNHDQATYDNSLTILSDIAFVSGNYKSAIAYSNEILQRGKKRNTEKIFTVEDYFSVALMYARIDDIKSARKYYDSAMAVVQKEKYNEVYFKNCLDGFFELSNHQYQKAINSFNKEIEILGYYNLLYIKKAEAFHHLGKTDSVKKILKFIESTPPNQNILLDYEGLKDYYPLKIKYATNKERESLIDDYTKFNENILAENNATTIEKYRHDYKLFNIEKENALKISTEKKKRDFFLGSTIVLGLCVIIISYRNANKNKKLELKLIKKQFETSKIERNRISRELHDDLGANFTSISLATEVIKMKGNKEISPELEIILKNIKDVYYKLNDIIWSMDTENDSLANLVQYTQKFMSQFLKNSAIQYKIIKNNIEEREVPLEAFERRQISLAIKEIVNNTVKHAGATLITIDFKVENDFIVIHIQDNGKGFNREHIIEGKGLENIINLKNRLKNCSIDLQSNSAGTLYTMTLKIIRV